MKYLIYFFLFVIYSVSSCKQRGSSVLTLHLKHTDYIETIDADGTVQAVNNIIFTTPRVRVSNLKVIYLAKNGALVKKGDTICIVDAPDLLSSLESFNEDLSKMEAEMRSLEADNAMQISLLEAQIETNNAESEIKMLDSIQMKFAPPVKQKLLALEMQKVNIERLKLRKKLASQKRINSSDVIQTQSRILMQKNMIQMFQNQLNSLTLLSPADGFVMHVEGPTFYTMGGSTLGGKIEEGSKVFPGMALIQIPDISLMQVSIEVQESDYKRINNDQKVMIQIESASHLKTTGKVIRKLPAARSGAEPTSVKTYEVIISVDSCHFKMKPGLSAICRIIVNQVSDTIVVPSVAVFMKDSTKIVYIADGDKFRPVAVETGLSGSSRTIISKGLEGNETIALHEPPYKLIRETQKAYKSEISPSVIMENDSVKK